MARWNVSMLGHKRGVQKQGGEKGEGKKAAKCFFEEEEKDIFGKGEGPRNLIPASVIKRPVEVPFCPPPYVRSPRPRHGKLLSP